MSKILGIAGILLLSACTMDASSTEIREPASAAVVADGNLVKFTIKKMTCSACASAVKNALLGVTGVQAVAVFPKTNQVVVTVKPGTASPDELVAVTNSIGFPALLHD
jgi:copper chaperone CopZ